MANRPKGYANWTPDENSRAVLAAVLEVIQEYRQYLPLTARQIFYRLVGAYNYPKTEQAYKRLTNKLVRARRAKIIPFDVIRDDGTVQYGATDFYGMAHFWDSIGDDAEKYQRQRQEGQDQFIEVWCEAAGMAPQLSRVTREYGIDVYSTGGFSSVTVTYEVSRRVIEREVPTIFLHVGDFDPSGQSIYESMEEDIWSFVAADKDPMWFRGLRVALTEEQVNEHGIETAPPKLSDSRSKNWIGETAQAEAMPPDLLAKTLENAIRGEMDISLMETLKEQMENPERDRLQEIIRATKVEHAEHLEDDEPFVP